jgi:hypothetical protein
METFESAAALRLTMSEISADYDLILTPSAAALPGGREESLPRLHF